MNSNNFTQSEAQSVSVFIHHLLNDRLDDSSQFDSKRQFPENGNSLSDAVRLFYFYNDFYTLSSSFDIELNNAGCGTYTDRTRSSSLGTDGELRPWKRKTKAITSYAMPA